MVPQPAKDYQPLPPQQAIVGAKASAPTPPVILAYYPFVERVLVEASIVGRLSISSQQNVILRVSIGTSDNPARVDYRGTWDDSGQQCDWNLRITSQNLRAGGTACLTSSPFYQSAEEWRDTILVGGTDASNDATVYATRGGTPADPVDCGPDHPTNCNCPDGSPCHSVSGQQTVTLIPLAATIKLTTPNVTQIAPKTILLPDPLNGSTTFKVSSTPTTYHGITVPAQALSWRWIPNQSDSAGGVTPQCPVPPTASLSNSCSITLYETGIMVVNGRVNGVPQSDTIRVVGPQINMSLTPSMMPSDNAKGVTSTQSIRVSVTDTAGNRIPSKTVRFWLTAVEGEAGHDHVSTSTPKPTGTIPITVNTGTSGEATVTYTAPESSGPIYIKATLSGAGYAQKKVMVEVPGLTEYTASTDYKLTGARTGLHTKNHFATSVHKQMLQLLASEYHKSFPTSEVLWFNDSSLPSGGVFDVSELNVPSKRWKPPHAWHRYGQDTDLRTNDTSKPGNPQVFSNAQKLRIWIIWLYVLPKATPYQRIIDHITLQDAPPHFHLIYCDGSTSTTLCH